MTDDKQAGDILPTNQVGGTPHSPYQGFAAVALGLARNPLSIIALFVVFIEGIISSLAFSSSFTQMERIILITFVTLFPIIVLGIFTWLVISHSGKLFAPSDYKNEDNYAALQRREIVSVTVDAKRSEEPHDLLSAPSDTSAPPPEKEKESEPPLDGLWLEPKTDWKESDYEMAIFGAMSLDQSDKVQEINQAYIAHIEATEPDSKYKIAAWQASIELTRIRFGKGGNISVLRDLADQNPNQSKIIEFLARAFTSYKDYAKAAETYEKASCVSQNDIEKIRLMGRAAVSYVRAGLNITSEKLTDNMKSISEYDRNSELEILRTIRDISEILEEKIAEIAAMERIVELDPSDSRTRFLLAYKHAKLGHNDLALSHYLEIPYQERDANAWNNIGVEFESFSLSAKSIEAYRKSEEMGETLAMSNLAERLLTAGFLAEARQLSENALAIKNHHQNVSRTLARIESLPEDEDKKEVDLIRKVKPKGEFYKLFGQAIARFHSDGIADAWRTPDCVIHATLVDGVFNALGSYEEAMGALGTALLGISGSAAPYRKIIEYSGTMQGRSVRGYVTRRREGEVLSILSATDNRAEILMVLSDDGSEFKVMETVSIGDGESRGNSLSSGIMKFYSIVRHNGVSARP